MGAEQAKIVVEMKDINQRAPDLIFTPRQKYLNLCVPLHKAALAGNWDFAERLLAEDPTLVKARVTGGGETTLHVASVQRHASFVTKLLARMEEADMEILSNRGNSALCFAAASGDVDIAKLMVQKNQKLPTMRGPEGVTPVYMAALLGHSDMVDYLFPLSGFGFWKKEDQITFLTTCIDSELYDIATYIVEQYSMLAGAEDCNGETPLEVLARKPEAFRCGSQQGLCGTIAQTILSYTRLKRGTTPAKCDAYTLLNSLWNNVICQDDVEAANGTENISKLLFVAAKVGNDEFLVELIRRYPDFLYKVNESKQSIFHIAVEHRYMQTFNLLFELGGIKDLIATYIDNDGNNMLHLAAKLAPEHQLNHIPGAALQMQRELLWYKEVEKIVQRAYRNMKNLAGETPYDVFIREHHDLMKKGEKLMKQTAKSCMLVTMLIATVVFTAAFTVPGGYSNNTGLPILLNEKFFAVFPMSEAVATLSSLTSMLMFLSILTSRYAENDFIESLPFWLVVGVTTLFVSIAAMMVAFCTCLLFYQHGLAVVTMLLIFFAIVPITFVILKYPLLVTLLRCTYGSRWLFRSNNRLFH